MRRVTFAMTFLAVCGWTTVAAHPVVTSAAQRPSPVHRLSAAGQLLVADRTARGLPALIETAELDAEALTRARQMIAQNTFSHAGWRGIPRGYCRAGENIAYGRSPFPADAVNLAWLNSPEHYANIVNPAFTALGVAEVTAPSGYQGQTGAVDVWVTEFAGSC